MFALKQRVVALSAIALAATLILPGLTQAKKDKTPPPPPVAFDMELLPEEMDHMAAMNQLGDIVGHEYLYISLTNTLIDLNDLIDTAQPFGFVIGDVRDISENGYIVGTGSIPETNEFGVVIQVHCAFLAKCNATLTGFESFYLLPTTMHIENYDDNPYDVSVSPEAVNNGGQVVGTASVTGVNYDEQHAFFWTAETGVLVDIMPRVDFTVPFYSTGNDINDAGQILGKIREGDVRRAYRYTLPVAGGEPEIIDVGDLRKRPENYPSKINELGDITGACRGPYYYERAYLFTDDDGMENLRTLFNSRYSLSTASSLNSFGHVVGRSGEAHDWTDPRSGAFLYTKEMGMVNLSTLIPDWDPKLAPRELDPKEIIDPVGTQAHGLISGTILERVEDMVIVRVFLLTPR